MDIKKIEKRVKSKRATKKSLKQKIGEKEGKKKKVAEKKAAGKSGKMVDEPVKNSNGEIVFPDYPDFRPNLTPKEMFGLGSFGGTYWRPIKSGVTGKKYKDVYKTFPQEWWEGLPKDWLTTKWENYNTGINQYRVKVGSTLEEWEEKDWISDTHPYGWVHWYCDFYRGNRCPDDDRQVNRWIRTAGPKSRWRRRLINLLQAEGKSFDDRSVSPKIRQILQHWGYRLTRKDFK